ncbi:MAG: capsular polysaccharide biosynthesis protein [Clostridiales bacterium]|nr:capsular polysaccharide biosynthesis protein [Clostridiales bacterium]
MIELTDFHSHILPSMDDGSSSVQESVDMLRLSYQGGVRRMVATPHFYAQKEPPERFLARRGKAWGRLASALPEDAPEVYLGAEVRYYVGISQTEALPRLCMEGTNLLLLEMPFQKWTERMTSEAIQIAQERGLRVLLAHIDRYLAFQSPDIWEHLAANGVLFQVNASAFLHGWGSRRRVCRMLRDGEIAALGSDCHNMTYRKPNLDSAVAVIQKKIGQEAVCMMNERADHLLASERSAAKP